MPENATKYFLRGGESVGYQAPKIINDRKIRFAVVGCGRISDRHTGALAKHDADAELAAICDTNETVLAEHCSKLNVPGFTSLDEMLAKTEADCVAICTPSGLHPYQAIQSS